MKTLLSLLRWLTPTLFFLIALSTSAQNRSPQDLFVEAMLKMRTYGVETIEGHPIDELIQKSRLIKVEFMPEIKFQSLKNQAEGVHRGSGYWDKSSNTVYFSTQHYDRLGPEQQWLVVHEFLEIMGLHDQSFYKSALMQSIDFYESKQDQNPGLVQNKTSLKTWKDQLMALGGGATGVGGGGDGRTLKYTTLIYFEIFYRLDRGLITKIQLQYLIEILRELNIEFSNSIQQGHFIFNQKEKTLRVPTDPGLGLNFDANLLAVEDLVGYWLGLMR